MLYEMFYVWTEPTTPVIFICEDITCIIEANYITHQCTCDQGTQRSMLEQISYDCEKLKLRYGRALPWPWRCRVLAFSLDEKWLRAIWLVVEISSMPCRDRAVFFHTHTKCSLYILPPSQCFSQSSLYRQSHFDVTSFHVPWQNHRGSWSYKYMKNSQQKL
jgi:hypothetical protein